MSKFHIERTMGIVRIVSEAFLLSTLLTFTVLGQGKTDADVRPLNTGQPVERELKGGEVHSYTLALKAGQFLDVIVEQKGIDVVVAFFDPNNKQLLEVDSPNGTQGPEPLTMIIETSGTHRLEVRSLEKEASAGRYEVKIKELRAASEKDKDRIAARKAFDEGEVLQQEGTAESLRTAQKKYEEAVKLYQTVGDKNGEAESLTQVGGVFYHLGENEQALKFYNASLPLRRAVGDKNGEAGTLSNIGLVYWDIGEQQQALETFNRSLLLFREVGENVGVATTLANIGNVYRDLGENERALEFYNESLPLRRTLGDKGGEALTLNSMGVTYSDLGEQQKALEFYNKSLSLFRAVGDKRGEAAPLSNIGATYHDLGELQQALNFYNESLPLRRAVGDKSGEAVTLSNIGLVYRDLGEKQQALKFFNESLLLDRDLGDVGGQAGTLSNIGLVYRDLGQNDQALKFYNDSLRLVRAIGDKRSEATTLGSIGTLYWASGERQKALKFYSESLPLFRAVGNKSHEAMTLGNLFLTWQEAGNSRFGIFYAKQSVNDYQILRSNVLGLDKNIQQTYLKSIDVTYRMLTDSLLRQGRLPEAQQILNSFKDQQYFDFNSKIQASLPELTDLEVTMTADLDQKLEEIVKAIRGLDGFKRGIGKRPPSPAEAEEIKGLGIRLTAANDDYQAFLGTAAERFAASPDDKDKLAKTADLELMQAALRETSAATKQGTVAVYTLVGEESFYALIITPDSIKSVSTPIKNKVLSEKAKQFWALLQTPTYDPSRLGQELYKTVFKPIERELPKGTKTILWSLDGNLRYVPMAALYDGKQYLVERFNNVNFTRADKERMTRGVKPNWTATAFGSSKEQAVELLGDKISFDPLPGVGEELSLLLKQKEKKGGIFDGEAFQDASFTQRSMIDALKTKRPVVHIASHFSFRPGDEARSFLLMGDGTAFTLADMKKQTDMFAGVDLLTLSACNTAAQQADANGRDIDAFFELAQRLGANSVMATLWSVADTSTPWLMREFYRTKRDKKLSKAEALRRAQLSLLYGKAEIKPLATRTNSPSVKIKIVDTPDDAKKPAEAVRTEIVNIQRKDAPLYDKAKHPPFAHPFYWSPFVLFGNWK